MRGNRFSFMRLVLTGFVLVWLLPGCSTNPVTGKSELNLVSTEQEIAIGKEKFSPYRQAQGGDYVADPGVQTYVQSVGDRLAAVSDRKLPYEFKVLNESSPNAWALPGGKIAVNRGLLVELESEAELAAVLGHEIVHAAARHTAQSLQRSLLLQGALIASNIALSDSDYRGLAMTGAQLGAGMINQKYGRDAEREADFYGMQYMTRAGYDPIHAVDLQQTFVRLSKDRKSNWLTGLFASHPPSQERVDNNRKTLEALGRPKGETGKQRYQNNIARLIKTKKGYEAYDDAKKAVKDDDYKTALKLLDKAIRIEPEEALFHGLKGEILADQGKAKAARKALDKAVALNPGYFKPYLARGFVRRDQGDLTGAKRDFEQSNNLLPTTESSYGLGWLAMKGGNNKDAISWFTKAANSDTDVGLAAGKYLAKLDLPNNPSRYIKSGLRLDQRGYLVVVLRNDSAVTVDRVRVIVGRNTGFGVREDAAFRVRQALKPGERITLSTGLGPIKANSLRAFASQVTSARIR